MDALTTLILNEKNTKWCIKINKEFSSRGIAYFSLKDLPVIVEIKNSNESEDFKIVKTKHMLKKTLSRVVRYAVPDLYPEWSAYVSKVEIFGASIQSMPEGTV